MAREMKDSGIEWIGYMPQNWEIKRISQVYDERKQKVSDKDYPPLSVTMQGIVPQLSNAAKTDAHDDRKLVLKGDFAINSRSDRRGSCGVSNYDGSVSLINIILKPQKEMNPIFYNWLFHSSMFSDEFYKWGHGIVDDLWTTNWDNMKRISIPYPPLSEQQQIADFLDEKVSKIDEILEKTNQSIEEYKKLKQAVITQAVTKGLDPDVEVKNSGVEWIGKIPKNWRLSKLKYLGTTQNGISKGGDSFGDGYPFVSYGDVYRNYSIPKQIQGLVRSTPKEQEIYSVLRGDIFFTRTSETIEEVGFSSVCEQSIPKATFAGFLIRFRPYDETLNVEYSKYYFRSNHFRAYLVKQMNLVTRASLGQPLLKSLMIIIPTKNDQEMIVDYLNKKCMIIDNIISKKEQLIKELETYKKSLIYDYVTGKKEVNPIANK